MNGDQLTLEVARLIVEAKKPDYLGDLIKIGLPLAGGFVIALIGHLSAKKTAEIQKNTQLQITDMNNKAAVVKEYEARRSARYETLIDQLDKFSRKLANHAANVENWIEDVKAGKKTPASRLSEIKKCESDFYDSFLDLLSADAKLLVCGETELQEELRSFGAMAQDLFKKVHIDNKGLTVNTIEAILKDMREKRKKLLLKIGEAERRYV